MISQPQIFIGEGVNVGGFFCAGAFAGVLEHTLDNAAGAFAMVVDFS